MPVFFHFLQHKCQSESILTNLRCVKFYFLNARQWHIAYPGNRTRFIWLTRLPRMFCRGLSARHTSPVSPGNACQPDTAGRNVPKDNVNQTRLHLIFRQPLSVRHDFTEHSDNVCLPHSLPMLAKHKI